MLAQFTQGEEVLSSKGRDSLIYIQLWLKLHPLIIVVRVGEEFWGGGVGDGLLGLRCDWRMLTDHSLKCSTVAPKDANGSLGDICVYVTLQQHGPLFVYTQIHRPQCAV